MRKMQCILLVLGVFLTLHAQSEEIEAQPPYFAAFAPDGTLTLGFAMPKTFGPESDMQWDKAARHHTKMLNPENPFAAAFTAASAELNSLERPEWLTFQNWKTTGKMKGRVNAELTRMTNQVIKKHNLSRLLLADDFDPEVYAQVLTKLQTAMGRALHGEPVTPDTTLASVLSYCPSVLMRVDIQHPLYPAFQDAVSDTVTKACLDKVKAEFAQEEDQFDTNSAKTQHLRKKAERCFGSSRPSSSGAVTTSRSTGLGRTRSSN